MYLRGKVQTAEFDLYGGLQLVVVDADVKKPTGGRPQYRCQVSRGWPGVDDVKALRKQNADENTMKQLTDTLPVPQEDQVLDLIVLDMTGKGDFKKFVCEVAAQQVP